MNQHYVPRIYLKNFSERKGKEFFIDVYDTISKNTFNTNTRKICAENDLYTLEDRVDLQRDKLAVEKFYSNHLEPIFQKAYDILVNDNISIISSQIRIEILLGIFQLYARNPQVLKVSIEYHKSNINKLYQDAINKNEKGITYFEIDFSFREWTREDIIVHISKKITNQFKERHLIGTNEVLNFHSYSKIVVMKINDNANFITSDNPLTFTDITTKNNHPLLRTKEFTIPLNPKYALKILHDKSKDLNKIYRSLIPNGSVGVINSEIEKQSTRFLLGSKEALDDYFEIKQHLRSTNVDMQIEMLRQTLKLSPRTPEFKEANDILQFFLDKYDKQGYLNNIDQFKMQEQIKKVAIKHKRKKI